MTTRVEDTSKKTVSTRLVSQVKARAKAKARETVTIVDHPGITQESAPAQQRATNKGKGFQGECYNSGEKGHPARECPKGKE